MVQIVIPPRSPASVNLGLSEKHIKFEKNLPHGFDKSADLLSNRQNHEEDFFKLCLLLKKSELYVYRRHGGNEMPLCSVFHPIVLCRRIMPHYAARHGTAARRSLVQQNAVATFTYAFRYIVPV